jgi:hypothetical protein
LEKPLAGRIERVRLAHVPRVHLRVAVEARPFEAF